MERAAATLVSPLDARRIAEEASGYEGGDLVLHLDDEVPARPGARFDALVARRAKGEPLQYVVGHWGFRTLDLMVDRRVLIPRPETEVVAGVAIDAARNGGWTTPLVVDLGTGSGAIAIAVATELATAEVWGTDASDDALAVARANLAGAGMTVGRRMRLVEGEWFAALTAELRGQVNVIVSNPPYVADDEELPSEVHDWEPAAALYAGPRGTEFLELLIDESPDWLTRDGVVVLELAPHQADAMKARATSAGYRDVRVATDLAGRERVLVARWP